MTGTDIEDQDATDQQDVDAEDVPSLGWRDLFCLSDSLQALLTDTWAARWAGRTYLTDNHLLWDADVLSDRITDRLPDLADGEVCFDPHDPVSRHVVEYPVFARRVADVWQELVEGPAAEDEAAWAAGRVAWSGYTARDGVIGIARRATGAEGVYVEPRFVELLDRLEYGACVFGTDLRIQVAETGANRVVGMMPAVKIVPIAAKAVLAAIADETGR